MFSKKKLTEVVLEVIKKLLIDWLIGASLLIDWLVIDFCGVKRRKLFLEEPKF